MARSVNFDPHVNIRWRWTGVKDYQALREELWTQVRHQVQQTLQALVEAGLQAECTQTCGAARYVRTPTRQTTRKGTYARNLVTTLGVLSGLRVPRVRGGPVHFTLLERYRRRTRAFDQHVLGCYLRGGTLRSTQRFFRAWCGTRVLSHTVIGRLYQTLDRQVQAFHRRAVPDAYVYLWLDAGWVRIRSQVQRRCPLLVAYGQRADGTREVLAFRIARGESEVAWTAFCQDLVTRGLTGQALRLVICDGARALHNAVRFAWPTVPKQSCAVHQLRGLAGDLRGHAHKRQVLAEAAALYRAPSRAAAYTRWAAWRQRWGRRAPRAVRNFGRYLDETWTYFQVPPADWAAVRSTNPIERVMKTLRDESRSWGSFADAASCERLMYAIAIDQNSHHAVVPLLESAHTS